MANEADFLAAIRERPDDLDTRLIYADWLEEQGDARCEMIRAAAQAERDHRRLPLRRVQELHRIRQDLWMQYGHPTCEKLEALGARDTWCDRYGLPYHVTLSAADFLEKAPQLARIAPITEATVVVSTAKDLIRLAVSPELEPLRGLSIRGPADLNAAIPLFCCSPHVRNLTKLSIRNGSLNDQAAHYLAESSRLQGVRELDLSANRLTDQGAAALARTRHLTRLKLVRMQQNALTEQGVMALLTAVRLPDLETLEIEGNAVGPALRRQVELFNLRLYEQMR